MKVTIEKPSSEWQDRIKALCPDKGFEVREFIELEIPWYHKEYWAFIMVVVVCRVCEIFVPDLKNEPNYIWIGHKKPRSKTNETK